MDKQILDEYKDIFLSDFTQNFSGLFFHPEAGGDINLNESLGSIYLDTIKIDDILIHAGETINDLLNNTVTRLEEVKKCIISEKERYQDVQMLCNKYTDFDNIKTLDNITFQGSHTYENGTISAPTKKTTKVNITVASVDGNGYEGNDYVYNNYEYQKDTYDTSLRENITDKKINTYYEYSRLTIPNDSAETNTYFNKDNAKARCTMSFEASDYVNYIDINTEDTGLVITSIRHSMDGIKYYDLHLPKKMSINNKLDSYESYGYVYGTGIISLPMCKFFKITFETDRNKDDVIAYEKTVFDNTMLTEDENSTVVGGKIPTTTTSTFIVKGAKRSAIRINNITAYKKVYSEKMQIGSNELMTGDGFSISLFANVYLPEDLDDNAVKFSLLINGIEYKVVPINSNLNGTKVIRFSGGKSKPVYTELINETIKSAKLYIKFANKSSSTPFVNNIKILIGGEV